MPLSRNKILLLWLALTLVNVWIYGNRDRFQYQPWSSYNALYKTDPGKWAHFLEGYPPGEETAARTMMDAVVRGDTSVQARAQHIAFFLYEFFRNRMGRPAGNFGQASPLTKYRMLAGDTLQKAWCGNMAEMYAYFCSTQGITCRYIEIIQEGDHHVVNEFYDPSTRRWQLVDLTHNLIGVQTMSGDPLDLIEFRKAVASRQSTMALQWDAKTGQKRIPVPGDLQGLQYYKSPFPLNYYHNLDGRQIFSPWQKAARYLLPLSWYDIYTEEKGSNIPFYLKEIFILLWLLAPAWLLVKSPKLNL